MEIPGRLRLKAELIARPQVPATVKPIARVWVDSGVFHLDSPYDYIVPARISDHVDVGVRVQVPFNGREVEAIVLERLDESAVTGTIHQISKLLSIHPVATATSLHLIEEVAKHWASTPMDILRSAVPARVASVDKSFTCSTYVSTKLPISAGARSFISFDPGHQAEEDLKKIVLEKVSKGSVLVIAPDVRDIDVICKLFEIDQIAYIRLDSSLPRIVRYENYLKAMNTQNCIVVGARSAVFTPISDLASIIVHKESSHEHFEIRTPGWNVRDVVDIRREREGVETIYMGYVPSLELSLLIENRTLTYVNHPHRLNVKAFSSIDGALLPGKIFSEIRKGLLQGPVLFLTPRKGYGNALLCAHCKNLAMCRCGAKLIVSSKGAAPICSLCHTTYPEWCCSWCQRDRQYLAGRGIERAGEEISRAFPGVALILSYGEVIKSSVENTPSLVLATPGAAPTVRGGYAAVVVLEALKFFAHPDLRAQERARELLFETAAMVNTSGSVCLSIDESHPIVASLIRWSPGAMVRRELAERMEIPLPPYVSSAVLAGPTKEFSVIVDGLRKSLDEKRLPGEIKIYGPIDIGKGQSKVVIYCPMQDRAVLAQFLHELQRRRSIAKKEYLTIRFDPYSL
ncbi:MAG: hypothetical protein F2680_02300 [Actinobacteria bacterium]|nr:hypothetical protein [Actinomycetota bacterium]